MVDNDDRSVPAFNSVYFMGTKPKEHAPAAALLYNPTLASANEAGVPGSSTDPHLTFIANDGITWVDADSQLQPMDVGGGDGHASDTGASVHSVHSNHPAPGTQVQVADTTQAMPCSSTSVTPASTMTGRSHTPFSSTPLSYPGALMPLTQLPVGSEVGAIDLEASCQAWLVMMKEWVRKLRDASTVLCQEYSNIVKAHSGKMEAAHADVLRDTNKYSAVLHVAIGEWWVDVERALQILSTSPGISTFNTQAEIVRVKTNQFREKVDTAEVAFLACKRKMEAGRAALLKWMKAELGTKVHATIEKFVIDKMTAALDMVGPTGDITPFIVQITQESADFRTHIAQVEMECSELRMHLQTASANQQLDILTTISRLLPLMCHLMYPAPSQQTGLMLAPGTGANVVRIGSDKRAPPPDNTERGKPARVTKVPKSEVVIVSDAASPMTSPAIRAPTRTSALASLAASAVPAQGQFQAMQQPVIHYGSHLQYGLGAASPMTAPGYTYGFPTLTSRVMPPPGFQFPGAGFQAGPGPCPRCLADLDQQDYLEGAPHPSHSEKNPHAGEANRDLTVDEGEEFFPIDSDGEDGSDCKIIEVMDPPSATTPVKTSKTKQKPIDKVMQQAAVKVGTACMDEILGTVSSSDGGDANTMLSTTPVKDKKARKSRKKE